MVYWCMVLLEILVLYSVSPFESYGHSNITLHSMPYLYIGYLEITGNKLPMLFKVDLTQRYSIAFCFGQE